MPQGLCFALCFWCLPAVTLVWLFCFCSCSVVFLLPLLVFSFRSCCFLGGCAVIVSCFAVCVFFCCWLSVVASVAGRLISCWCASRLLAARALQMVRAFDPASSLELLCPHFWSFRFAAASGAASAASRLGGSELLVASHAQGPFSIFSAVGISRGGPLSKNFIW